MFLYLEREQQKFLSLPEAAGKLSAGEQEAVLVCRELKTACERVEPDTVCVLVHREDERFTENYKN